MIRNLAGGGYLDRAEPVVLLGETGTGKTHLAIGLAVAACRQRKRVRYTTAAALVNDLMEAKDKSELNRITRRWTRHELIVIDEMGYVAIPESAAELLFQVIAGRAEKAAVIVTTNLPFIMTTENSPASMVENSPTPVMVFDWVLGRDRRRGRGGTEGDRRAPSVPPLPRKNSTKSENRFADANVSHHSS